MIKLTGLTKTGRPETASVDHITVQIPSGETVCLLGPAQECNTALLQLMAGCVDPDEGSVSINGLDIVKDAQRAKPLVGYAPQGPLPYPGMTVREYLTFAAEARGAGAVSVRTFLEMTELSSVWTRQIRNLAQPFLAMTRCAQAFAGRTEIVLLDEPFDGLDPEGAKALWQMLDSLCEGRTLIMTMSSPENIRPGCRVLTLSRGTIAADGIVEAQGAQSGDLQEEGGNGVES